MRISAGVAIYYKDKILLIHPIKTPMHGTWSVPKGEIEKGETPLEAALRETHEEVGIHLDPDSIVNEPRIFNYTNKKNITFKKVYLFTLCIESLSELNLDTEMVPQKNLQKSEVDMAMFFTKNNAKDYMFWRFRPLLDKM